MRSITQEELVAFFEARESRGYLRVLSFWLLVGPDSILVYGRQLCRELTQQSRVVIIQQPCTPVNHTHSAGHRGESEDPALLLRTGGRQCKGASPRGSREQSFSSPADSG